MRAKGVTYDTGFVRHGAISRESFDLGVVRRELSIIHNDLLCTAVRIIGGDPARLQNAAAIAAELGMEVWFSPYPLELTADELLMLLIDCAERAETLRRHGAEVVFVAGAELSLMNVGFLPGNCVQERVELLTTHPHRLAELVTLASARVNDFLRTTVAAVRERFNGKVTYASVPLDRVDWTPFDIVSVDLYRSAEIADQLADGVRDLVAQGKPVAITEFGAATFRGAGALGARALQIVENDEQGAPIRLNGVYVRDEAGQADYLRELLEVFDAGGVDSAFVFTFSLSSFPHRPDGDPRDDLDLASYGIVKVLEDRCGETYPDMQWEPKAAFTALADYYGGH